MGSALGASRSFVSHALARVRSGVVSQGTGEGPPIHVEPFDATNVSTPAALIKLGTSIAAARRQRANFAAAQQDADLAREGTRAQIALLRAQGKYYEGTGRQNAGRAPAATLSQDVGQYKAGTDLGTVNAGMANTRINQTAANEERIAKARGRVAAAQAGQRMIDARVKREAEDLANSSFAEFAPSFQKAATGDEETLKSLDISPADFSASPGATLAKARQRIRDDLVRLHTEDLSKKYRTKRDEYQQTIDLGVGGFEGQPPDQGGTGDQGGTVNLVYDKDGNLVPE